MVLVHDKIFVPYLSSVEIDNCVDEVAAAINQDYKDKQPIFIGILNGSFMFASDLLKKITVPCQLNFAKFASYQGTQSSGEINELIGFNNDIEGRDVIVVEDIVDTGQTMEKILDILGSKGAKSVRIATLLYKPDVFDKKFEIHYIGKAIPNKFVIGYGLDYNQLGRNFSEIYQLQE